MEEGLEDKMLSDLFRHKLENAEVEPSPSVSAGIMRATGRREFLHFNPSRFNIWYAGVVIVSGVALSILLSPPSDQKIKDQVISDPPENTISGLQSDPPVKSTAASDENNSEKSASPVTIRKTGIQIRMPEGRKTEVQTAAKKEHQPGEQAAVSNIKGKEILPDLLADNNKLKGITRDEQYIWASAEEGCSPLKVSFRCIAVPFDSCKWLFGDGGFSTLKDPVWIFDIAGEYKVNLNVFSSGSRSVSSVIITVHPKPQAKFEITPENALLPQDEISFHNYSDGAEKFKWDFGDATSSELFEPHHNYRKPGSYNVRLIAISAHGCTDSIIIDNAFPESGYYIVFPNAFIPNGNGPSGGFYSSRSDESSQIFHPVFSGVSSYQLRIFNKGGALLFESNDISYGWDGYYKGSLCDPGVYIWKVRGNYMSGDPFTKMGDVTLLKN